MFKLRYGMLITGLTTGFILLATFFSSLPDGKLHIVFCDVGQGDAAYIRFPDGRDMLVDTGPRSARILTCLTSQMPFWDRSLDIVMITHPEKDHIGGAAEVLRRYSVGYVVRPNIDHTSEIYQEFRKVQQEKSIPEKYVDRGQSVAIGNTRLSLLWPTEEKLASMRPQTNIAGASTATHLNDASVVFALSYGEFDAVFTGDADTRVENGYVDTEVSVDPIEVLKVPHHGSRTGFSKEFIDWISPDLAVISVGKNSYGHPHQDILKKLADNNIRVLRTDQEGDIEIVSDGKSWTVKKNR